MAAGATQFIAVGGAAGDGRRIAAHCQPADGNDSGPGLIWLPGFRSEMMSTKACVLADWSAARGLALTRFDYSGHGQSGGRFEDGTIGNWLAEADAVFSRLTDGPQILVGSSMGGWIALLLLRGLLENATGEAARIRALVLIAPAWDMSEELWQAAPQEICDELRRTGLYLRPSAYGDGPYPITLRLIEEGRKHLIGPRPFNPGRRVHIVHGRLDADVPFKHSEALQRLLPGNHVEITEQPDGAHRLSRPQDLDLLLATIGRLVAKGAPGDPA